MTINGPSEVFIIFVSDSVQQRKSQGTGSNKPRLYSLSFRCSRINIIYYNLITVSNFSAQWALLSTNSDYVIYEEL
jgi:hypothetical protein